MMDNTQQLLSSISQMDGVWATFLLSRSGELLLWDVPRIITEDVLDNVAFPLSRLREALGRGDPAIDFCVLRFAAHRLCLHATADGMICILTSPAVNLPALKIAATMTLRRLNPYLRVEGREDHV
jgi:hypothetical protein